MSTRENLTHGPAWIAVAPLGTALPATLEDAVDIVDGSFTGFTTIGQTETPVTFRDKIERKDTKSQQSLRAVAQHVTSADAEVTTTLLEVASARIAEAVAGTATSGVGVVTIDPASVSGQPDYYALAVVGPHLADRTMLWVAECVAVASDLELAYGREDDTTLEVTWRVYEGTAAGLGAAGYKGRSFGA